MVREVGAGRRHHPHRERLSRGTRDQARRPRQAPASRNPWRSRSRRGRNDPRLRPQRVRLFVVKQNRFNVPVVKLREALEAGRFGKLVLGTVRVRWCRRQDYYDQDPWRGTWALDGGVLDEPGEPSRRSARVDDGRSRVGIRQVDNGTGRHRGRGHGRRGAQVPLRRSRRSSRRPRRLGRRTSKARSRSSAKAARWRSAVSRSTR